LRTYEKPKAWAVDAFGCGLAALVTTIFREVQYRTIDKLPHMAGFEWMSAAAHVVDANLAWPVAFLFYLTILDLLTYIGHRLLHTSYLWHTHAVHHSVEHLYWLGGNRASPFHVSFQLMWSAFLGLVLPINGGVTAFVAVTLLYTSMQHFNHANLNWRLGPLEWLLVVPRYHFVHHGADPRLNNSNFGFLFTIWDRMFGTYTDPDKVPQNFPLGLNYDVGLARLFIGLPPAEG
jgi:sterol desaturase/sphingolipid hydroxylase (fatty acid hydroxylase superfamily)